MTRNKIEMQVLAELYDQMVSLLEEAPEHGFLILKIHMRDGMPLRYETSREESVLFKKGIQIYKNSSNLPTQEIEQPEDYQLQNFIKTIQNYCLECLGCIEEVRECCDKECFLHPYRLGKNPFNHFREIAERQRKFVIEQLKGDK